VGCSLSVSFCNLAQIPRIIRDLRVIAPEEYKVDYSKEPKCPFVVDAIYTYDAEMRPFLTLKARMAHCLPIYTESFSVCVKAWYEPDNFLWTSNHLKTAEVSVYPFHSTQPCYY